VVKIRREKISKNTIQNRNSIQDFFSEKSHNKKLKLQQEPSSIGVQIRSSFPKIIGLCLPKIKEEARE
jgi:hypothetical protein